MTIESLSSLLGRMDFNYGGVKSASKNDDSKANKIDKVDLETVKEKYDEVQKSKSETTFKVWDDHNDMVKKSNELRETRNREDAIKRRTQERDDAEDELRAKMAIENANRSSLLEASAMKRKAEEQALI